MWKLRHKHCMTWNIARNTEKGGKMRNILGRTWNMARVLKIMENEKHTLYDVKYGKKKQWKTWKKRKTHCRTNIMARKRKYVKNETQILFDLEYGEKHWKGWKMRNAHCMMWNMASNTEKREKWEKHTVGPGLWRETLKKLENEKCTL